MSMAPDVLASRLHGVIAFPVTPFHDDLSLDIDGFRRNLRMLLDDAPSAIVAAGGTGELYSLTPEEHLAVVRAAVEEVAGAVPVIAGVGFNAAIARALAHQSAAAGASGILAFPPYFPGAEDDGLVHYYRAIGDASPLGMIVYSRDWFHPSPALVERLAAVPSLVAWKDGQGDVRRLQIVRAHVGSRLQWIGGAGDDLVPAYYGIGIRAFTSSVANVSPRMALQLHEAGARGDAAALDALMSSHIVPLYALRARRRGYEVSAMKALMNLLGLAGGVPRPPVPQLRPDDLAYLQTLLPAWQTAIASARPIASPVA
jgi:5-dehydro-4-deoxyglucarate dehydratase